MRVTGLLLSLGVVMAGTLVGCEPPARDVSWSKTPSAAASLRRFRSQSRAYEGAPPIIPHAVASSGREGCLGCHQAGEAIAGKGQRLAPITPHPSWANCQQCHVEQRALGRFRRSTFVGLRPGPRPDLAHALGPPYIPHRLQDREDCRTCHLSDTAPPALVPAHGERTNCRQCHLQLQEAVAPFAVAESATAQKAN